MQSQLSFGEQLFHILHQIKKTVFSYTLKDDDQYHGLRLSEFTLLWQLSRSWMAADPNTTGIPVSTLCQMSHTSKSNISQILRALEERAFIQRFTSPQDRRLILVQPTDTGMAVVANSRFPGIDVLNDAAQYMGPEKSRLLLELLEAYNEGIEHITSHSKEGDLNDKA
ncbi:DNA-binding transcriptional regulator, MarR family [Eubacterium aggregans]|uniref:DNA-binding transcriptional regulator, MarR family n=2 Tax=Eubacterium aggregans TaxID=81409 RepID=A0A1H4A422_9FIRM|nr:MarR family transcriptional regulator [Eubacterium aggregans]SEA30302.1 DNA-binding transcriptional regulator, MarR family [Eubacterium aggregans]